MLTLYDHVFEPIVILDLERKLIHTNPSFNIFTKQPPRVLKNIEFLHQLFDAKNFDLDQWIAEGLLKLELRVSPEIEIVHVREKDATSHVVLRQYPINLAEGTFVAVAFHDISIEKNLFDKYRQQIDELRATHAQIVQADKLATLGEMTATISHEISNPLTIASGNSEMIEAYLESGDVKDFSSEIKKANINIRESIDRIHTIIRNMKNFLWQNEDSKEYCSLSETVQSALVWVKGPIESSGTKIEKRFLDQDSIILANKVKIEQVIINLIKNAIDAMVEARTPSPTIFIEVSREESNAILITIHDNGPGIPKVMKDNLFKPFTTSKRAGEGTGLGLSISQRIIESHQGQLQCLDTEIGTAFQIRLPTIEGYSFTRGDKVSRGLSAKHGPRVLVVDNEPQILNVLSRFLEDEGYHVIASARPEDALRFISKMDVDLLLTDLSMPNMNGHELAQKARAQGHHGPILYMSATKNAEAYNRDRDPLKIAGMILKPFTRDEVIRTAKVALGGRLE